MSTRRVTEFARAAIGALVFAAVLTAFPTFASGDPVRPSSLELVEHPGFYDQEQVEFEGEAIGEAMVRGDYAWIHLNDDAYKYKNVEEGARLGGFNSGMSVWIEAGQLLEDGIYGDYKHEGDIVRVTGVFNAACAEHGGDMDVHAVQLRLVTPGRGVVDPIDPRKFVALLVLSAALLGVGWAESRARNNERAGLGSRA